MQVSIDEREALRLTVLKLLTHQDTTPWLLPIDYACQVMWDMRKEPVLAPLYRAELSGSVPRATPLTSFTADIPISYAVVRSLAGADTDLDGRRRFADSLWAMLADCLGRDIGELAFYGDTASGDPFWQLLDGFLKQGTKVLIPADHPALVWEYLLKLAFRRHYPGASPRMQQFWTPAVADRLAQVGRARPDDVILLPPWPTKIEMALGDAYNMVLGISDAMQLDVVTEAESDIGAVSLRITIQVDVKLTRPDVLQVAQWEDGIWPA